MQAFKRPLRAASLLACLLVCLLVCLLACAPASAQEKREPRQPSGLALEIDTKVDKPYYHPVPSESFGGRYIRLPSGRTPSAASRVAATFRLRVQVEDEAVRVRVWAIMDRFHYEEILIGNYLLHETERATVEEMKRYGYEPMEVAVVKVKPTMPLLPSASSRVPSVGVEGVEPKASNFPAYTVTLRNLSSKEISYLEVQNFISGQSSIYQWPHDMENRPIIKPGERYEVEVGDGMRGVKVSDEYTPSLPQQVVVVAVVFADKSHEGDRRSIAHYLASLKGHKLQLSRTLDLIRNASESRNTDAAAVLENLKAQLLVLGREAPPNLTQELSEEFPDLSILPRHDKLLKSFAESGMNQVRKQLLGDIEGFEQTHARPFDAKAFARWLGQLKTKYEDWHARL